MYPPCNSVFYQLNQNPEKVDVKKRYQINPRLTDEELQAIYDSFIIDDADEIITKTDGETGEEIQVRFADIIKDCVFQANGLPMARLWLRQIPAGVPIKIMRDEEAIKMASGLYWEGEIHISPEKLKSTVKDIAILLMHEMAHMVDRTNLGGLNLFPYNAVNDGEKLRIDDSNASMSEAEYLQCYLIDEAEKHAFNNQLFFEAGMGWKLYRYGKRINRTFGKYAKLFQNWTPPSEAGVWTREEIETERMARAYHYTALESMSGFMREFIKSYDCLFGKLPKKMDEAIVLTNLGPIIDFNKIPKLNLTMPELMLTTDVLASMRENLSYRMRAYNNLMVALKTAWCEQDNINIDALPYEKYRKMGRRILNNPKKRNELMRPEPSEYFAEFSQRIEGRYMGFIRASELQPRLNPIASLFVENRSNVHKEMIDILDSYAVALKLFEIFDKGLHQKLDPYYIKRFKVFMREYEQSQLAKQQKRQCRARTGKREDNQNTRA